MAIEGADEVLYLVPDPISTQGIETLNPRARSLAGCYAEAVTRREVYARMVDEILAPVRAGRRVCAAFYGHPGVFVLPSHDAVACARHEGFEAVMLPGVSAEACLIADLGVDPARSGWQSYEASYFLHRRPALEPTSALVLWQVGVVGEREYSPGGSNPGFGALVAALLEHFPADHEAVVYEATSYPGIAPLIKRVALATLDADAITPLSTIYVPPLTR